MHRGSLTLALLCVISVAQGSFLRRVASSGGNCVTNADCLPVKTTTTTVPKSTLQPTGVGTPVKPTTTTTTVKVACTLGAKCWYCSEKKTCRKYGSDAEASGAVCTKDGSKVTCGEKACEKDPAWGQGFYDANAAAQKTNGQDWTKAECLHWCQSQDPVNSNTGETEVLGYSSLYDGKACYCYPRGMTTFTQIALEKMESSFCTKKTTQCKLVGDGKFAKVVATCPKETCSTDESWGRDKYCSKTNDVEYSHIEHTNIATKADCVDFSCDGEGFITYSSKYKTCKCYPKGDTKCELQPMEFYHTAYYGPKPCPEEMA